MKTLYLDTFSGVSGDMVLGLLIDLGLPQADLEHDLKKLPVGGWQLETRREKRQGIEGTRAEVHCTEQHQHRSWEQIDAMLAASSLEPQVGAVARRIFRRLGIAEAKVHGVALEKVHFHEVGAIDSIVDIVGAAIGLHRLGIEKTICTPLPLSRGMVRTAHGNYPLPAPATAEVLRKIPVTDAASERELVTPTGAAIVATIAEFAPLPDMVLERTGYGVGGWHLPDRPNLLRGFLGRVEPAGETDQVMVLETHLDDANPEWLGHLLERLLTEGALDAACSPLQMKKNRPGVRITVVAPPAKSAELSRLLLRESSAIGVRRYAVERLKLRRQEREVVTTLGAAEVKLLFDGTELVRITPEYESCRRLAAASGRPLPEVYRLVERAADELFEEMRKRE